MFFLGIAGSFAPYLILLGTLFFLTIGTNTDKAIELAKLDDKTITETPFAIPNFETVGDYHFFQEPEKQSNNEHQIQVFPPGIIECMVIEPCKMMSKDGHILPTNSGFRFAYSGLSPPLMIL